MILVTLKGLNLPDGTRVYLDSFVTLPSDNHGFYHKIIGPYRDEPLPMSQKPEFVVKNGEVTCKMWDACERLLGDQLCPNPYSEYGWIHPHMFGQVSHVDLNTRTITTEERGAEIVAFQLNKAMLAKQGFGEDFVPACDSVRVCVDIVNRFYPNQAYKTIIESAHVRDYTTLCQEKIAELGTELFDEEERNKDLKVFFDSEGNPRFIDDYPVQERDWLTVEQRSIIENGWFRPDYDLMYNSSMQQGRA